MFNGTDLSAAARCISGWSQVHESAYLPCPLYTYFPFFLPVPALLYAPAEWHHMWCCMLTAGCTIIKIGYAVVNKPNTKYSNKLGVACSKLPTSLLLVSEPCQQSEQSVHKADEHMYNTLKALCSVLGHPVL